VKKGCWLVIVGGGVGIELVEAVLELEFIEF
jgi:hypothetical protein